MIPPPQLDEPLQATRIAAAKREANVVLICGFDVKRRVDLCGTSESPDHLNALADYNPQPEALPSHRG